MYNDNRKTIILILLGIAIVSISIAYATLQTNLNIGGSVSSPSSSWDIHFINFSSASTPSTTNSGDTNAGRVISVSTSNTSITNLKTEFKKPGDSIVYTFDIKNFGSIPAKLDSHTDNITCSPSCRHADYSILCLKSGVQINNSDVLSPNEVINCTLTLKYREDANISDDITASISASWNFSQN